MIDKIIGHVARKQFARAMNFREGTNPVLPAARAGSPCLLYLHVPFCEKLCPYCSFNRVTFDEALCREYFGALRGELSLYKARGYNFEGIYVGGGTPTVMVDELASTLQHAKSLYPIREISVETNPNHLTDSRFFRQCRRHPYQMPRANAYRAGPSLATIPSSHAPSRMALEKRRDIWQLRSMK